MRHCWDTAAVATAAAPAVRCTHYAIHQDPAHDDDALGRLVRRDNKPRDAFTVEAAREGMTFGTHLPAGPERPNGAPHTRLATPRWWHPWSRGRAVFGDDFAGACRSFRLCGQVSVAGTQVAWKP